MKIEHHGVGTYQMILELMEILQESQARVLLVSKKHAPC